MRRILASALAALGVMAACGGANPLPGTPDCEHFERSIDFVADLTFTADERAALDAAASDWGRWSAGRVKLTVHYGAAVGSPSRIVRTTGDQDPIARVEADRRKAFNQPGYWLAGLTTGDPPSIYLAMDRIGASDLHVIVAHEMGHAAGLLWPNCDDEPRAAMFPTGEKDCAHVNTPGALMAPAYDAEKTAWGDADLALCRASCLCP